MHAAPARVHLHTQALQLAHAALGEARIRFSEHGHGKGRPLVHAALGPGIGHVCLGCKGGQQQPCSLRMRPCARAQAWQQRWWAPPHPTWACGSCVPSSVFQSAVTLWSQPLTLTTCRDASHLRRGYGGTWSRGRATVQEVSLPAFHTTHRPLNTHATPTDQPTAQPPVHGADDGVHAVRHDLPCVQGQHLVKVAAHPAVHGQCTGSTCGTGTQWVWKCSWQNRWYGKHRWSRKCGQHGTCLAAWLALPVQAGMRCRCPALRSLPLLTPTWRSKV